MQTPAGPEKITYQGKIIEVVEQPMDIDGKLVTFERARRSPGTRVIIPTRDAQILLSKEFRHELKGYDYRLPGGKVFDTLDEYNKFLADKGDMVAAAQKAAAKEALEEIGVTAETLDLFGISRCGVTVEWDLYYFIVGEHSIGMRRDSGEGEDITTVPVPVSEARAMCLDGRMGEERSALMLLRYLER